MQGLSYRLLDIDAQVKLVAVGWFTEIPGLGRMWRIGWLS